MTEEKRVVNLFEDPGFAVVKVSPGRDDAVVKLLDEIMRAKEWADKLVVSGETGAQAAVNDLSLMGKLQKAVEDKRQEYVGPLNKHVKAVNDAFRLLTGPLAAAILTANIRVTAYKVEQKRIRAEADEVNRLAEEVARRQAILNNGEFSVETKPVEVVTTPRLTRTEMATGGLVDSWQYEVLDIDQLPREYMIPDGAMLGAIATKHHDAKKVPGVRFFNKPHLRVSNH